MKIPSIAKHRIVDAHMLLFDFERHPEWWPWTKTAQFCCLREQNHMPSNFGPTFADLGVRGCIAIEAGHGKIEETVFLNDQGPLVLAVTSTIDPLAPDFRSSLEAIAGLKKVRAARTAAPGRAAELYGDTRFRDGVRAIGAAGLLFELRLGGKEIRAALDLVTDCPATTFVLDHIGNPPIGEGDAPAVRLWSSGLNELAQRPNVAGCKTSGLLGCCRAEQAYHGALDPFLRTALQAFGVGRLLYGSDAPMHQQFCDYLGALALQVEALQTFGLGENELCLFLYENAERIYNIAPPRG